ncbi:PREDICTED: uncharacterized protein LOC107072899 [Polistes dominula]|uniref:Uncharacterized protein LOC107072899 n=1 Tax=Polistes dominula TaxID=743375 RepID=A0ABM1J8A7_POLDO|nr:PREDICTED: uncharacterized protein LOC107072899 [Polistes dominula]
MVSVFSLIKFAIGCVDKSLLVQGRSINYDQSNKLYYNACDFDITQRNYDSIDLLRCIKDIVLTSIENSAIHERSRKHAFFDRLSSKNSPLTDLFVSLFNNGESNMGNQISQLLNTGSSQYQSSQYESAVGSLLDPSGGPTGYTNLFDALSSISRYDDLKCVPRILCEVTSGAIPGESIYGRDINLFNNLFQKNILSKLLTKFHFIESSPIFNFGKAALLGYTNRNNPNHCYQEYPKCPRNNDQLIHYLNNHNGGFFRYFNQFNRGNIYNKPYVAQRNKEYLYHNRFHKNEAPYPRFDYSDNSDFSNMKKLQFDNDNKKDIQNYEPRIRNEVNRIVFPDDDEESTKFVDTSNRLPKTVFDFEGIQDTDDVQQDDFIFFPTDKTRTEKYEESNQLYNSFPQSSEPSSRSFVFPDD